MGKGAIFAQRREMKRRGHEVLRGHYFVLVFLMLVLALFSMEFTWPAMEWDMLRRETAASEAGNPGNFLSAGDVISAEEVLVALRGGNLEEGIRFSSSLLKRLFMGREEGRVSFVPGEEEDLLRVEGGSGMLSVTVPVEVHALCVRLHSGDLFGAGLHLSSLDIHSSSGDIMLNDCSLEALNVESASGDVELEDILGEQRIGTASGDITLTGSRGCVEIGTASGDISVYDHGGGALQLHSSSGDMEAETQAALTAESASGDMELTVTDAAGYVTASSASGDISCYIKGGRYRAKLSTRSGDLLNHSGKQSSSGGREIHLGEGETLVELQTSSGDILLEEV